MVFHTLRQIRAKVDNTSIINVRKVRENTKEWTRETDLCVQKYAANMFWIGTATVQSEMSERVKVQMCQNKKELANTIS